jgi:hypothetical protein
VLVYARMAGGDLDVVRNVRQVVVLVTATTLLPATPATSMLTGTRTILVPAAPAGLDTTA